MQVVGFSVENLRSVRRQVRVTDLAAWDVFHGENNVGKSNLMLALRTALGLVDRVWPRRSPDSNEATDDVESTGQGRAQFRADSLPAGIEPHWDQDADPIRLGLALSDGVPGGATVRIRFDLRRIDNLFHVEGRWADGVGLDFNPAEPTPGPFPFKVPEVRHVDASRSPPAGSGSWDEWFLSQLDADDDGGPWLAAYRRLERTLRELVPGFEGGRLDRLIRTSQSRKGVEHRSELVWFTRDDRRVRFDSQGSGVRAIKDLLIAAAAGHGLCIIEEPELHLSEASQVKLRQTLESLAAPGRGLAALQVLMTSHTAVFDHPGARRVRVEDGSTQVEPPRPRAISAEAAVGASWVAEGAHNAGYVSSGGVVLLPPSVREVIALPALVDFTPWPGGRFLMAPVTAEVQVDEDAP